MYKFILPNADNQPEEYNIESNSVIIIGANGSGKTRLGVWIEKNSLSVTHRIGAQRSLSFGNYIQQKGYEQSSNLMIYGNEIPQTEHDARYKWDGEEYNYATSLMDDYEYALSMLLALKIRQEEKYITECKLREKEGKPHSSVPENVVDKLQRIWNYVFPHRDICVEDGKVIAKYKGKENTCEYKGKNMSDGERVALYLMAQVLSMPKAKTIIIDEPEIHLHRSIMNRLWTAIENERDDCLFIYITHDTQFAASHVQAKKIWVKNYDGTNWQWEEIQSSILPEHMLLDILGNRKDVLFVEGTIDSYDTKLYSEIFKKYYVVACGSCSTVIAWTKAMNKTAQLHDLKCYGIIDRDYRSDYEIEAYRTDGIYALKVAEVENLFLVPEVLQIVNNILGYQDDSKVNAVKKYIVDERFKKEINGQICESVVSELKYKLSVATISKKNEEEAKNTISSLLETLSYDEIRKQREKLYTSIAASRDYKEILKIFNKKALASSIGHFWGIDNKGYCEFVIRQLKTDKGNEIMDAIALYLPEEISRKLYV